MKAASSKTKGLMFHLREYLLTEKAQRRNFILRVSHWVEIIKKYCFTPYKCSTRNSKIGHVKSKF